MAKNWFFIFICLLFVIVDLSGQINDERSLFFSAIRGTLSKPDTIQLNGPIPELFRVEGAQANQFKVQRISQTQKIVVSFAPPSDFIGVALGSFIIGQQKTSLTGLSTRGLEGENEAPLAQICSVLGYQVNIGWTTLANHCRPELQGEELQPALFKKAGPGLVEMIPLARYSPDFLLNFGYYTSAPTGPLQHQVGVLSKAKKFPEHQTLFPSIVSGSKFFEPSGTTFGFYALSPSHTAYSEDLWNMLLYPTHAAHAARIYPARDKSGKVLKNSYLLCFEEASNGDYNDYVFLLNNVEPVLLKDRFISLFNGKNFDGWYSWFSKHGMHNDPNAVFTIEKDGIIHDSGKDLGYIMTHNRFDNYHFTLEFKWGVDRWAPRDTNKRDSGICYNIPDGEEDHIWPSSIECQIQEGDVGDFWLLDNATIQVAGKQNAPSAHTQIVKKKDAEKPTGEWNTVEVISFNGKCVHVVNGEVVNFGENANLIGGRILLQSEYAEIYYRNIRLRAIH